MSTTSIPVGRMCVTGADYIKGTDVVVVRVEGPIAGIAISFHRGIDGGVYYVSRETLYGHMRMLPTTAWLEAVKKAVAEFNILRGIDQGRSFFPDE